MFGFIATIVYAIDFYITFNDLVTFLKQGSSDSPEGHKSEGRWNSLFWLYEHVMWDFLLHFTLHRGARALTQNSFYSWLPWVCMPQLYGIMKLLSLKIHLEFKWFIKRTGKPGMGSFSRVLRHLTLKGLKSHYRNYCAEQTFFFPKCLTSKTNICPFK